MARPSKYDPRFTPQLAKFMRRCGLTDKEIAAHLQISESTLNEWKRKHREFSESLKESANFIDSLVEDSLLKRALGYVVIEETFERKRGKQIRVKKVRKTLAPDTIAAIFWLKNRQKERWREKPAADEIDSETVSLEETLGKSAAEVWTEGGEDD